MTVREFDGGLHAEAGAARISVEHDLTIKYIEDFGLKMAPFYPSAESFVRLRNGGAERIDWKRYVAAIAPSISLGKAGNWKKIGGGNDLLPKAFADKLGGKIRFEAPVGKIEQDRDGVTVHFAEKGRMQMIRGDLLVLAIPFTMLAKIEVTPRFSKAKADVIRTITYESASRVLLETKKRFWHDSKLNGFALGENLTEIWDGTLGESGTGGILQKYIRFDDSVALTRQTPDERLKVTLSSLEKLLPGTRANYVRGFTKCWSEDPWTRGAWGLLAGDRLTTGRAREGRIFFAGEHLSGHASWMQGALQSGLSAVEDIKKFKLTSANL